MGLASGNAVWSGQSQWQNMTKWLSHLVTWKADVGESFEGWVLQRTLQKTKDTHFEGCRSWIETQAVSPFRIQSRYVIALCKGLSQFTRIQRMFQIHPSNRPFTQLRGCITNTLCTLAHSRMPLLLFILLTETQKNDNTSWACAAAEIVASTCDTTINCHRQFT